MKFCVLSDEEVGIFDDVRDCVFVVFDEFVGGDEVDGFGLVIVGDKYVSEVSVVEVVGVVEGSVVVDDFVGGESDVGIFVKDMVIIFGEFG